MTTERSGSVPEEGEVAHEIRTTGPDSNDVLDFEPYDDEPEDEVHPLNRAQPEATQDVPYGRCSHGRCISREPS